MTAPVAPFCESTDVAIFFPELKGAADFTSKDDPFPTTPTKETVDSCISFASAHIAIAFRQAGYVLPFAALSDETWPDDQTTYLKFLCAIGAASLAGGYALSATPKRKKEQDAFQAMYAEEMARVYDARTKTTSLRFRAEHYRGTPAELAVSEPFAPVSDHLEGYYDPIRELPIDLVADKLVKIEQVMVDRHAFWDYAYDIFGINKGLGATAREVSW